MKTRYRVAHEESEGGETFHIEQKCTWTWWREKWVRYSFYEGEGCHFPGRHFNLQDALDTIKSLESKQKVKYFYP